MCNQNSNWTDEKKWQMELRAKIIMAILIAGIGGLAAVLIDQRFQSHMNENNRIYEQKLEKHRFEVSRATANARFIENTASKFIEATYLYLDAEEAAFKDTFYRHDQFYALGKGDNQKRYEDKTEPRILVLMQTIALICKDAGVIIEKDMRPSKGRSYEAYQAVENLPKGDIDKEKNSKFKKALQKNASSMLNAAITVYQKTLLCADNVMYPKLINLEKSVEFIPTK